MKLFIIPQYQRMMDHFRAVANGCATDKTRNPICRMEAKDEGEMGTVPGVCLRFGGDFGGNWWFAVVGEVL